jgi:hypothetical protein
MEWPKKICKTLRRVRSGRIMKLVSERGEMLTKLQSEN